MKAVEKFKRVKKDKKNKKEKYYYSIEEIKECFLPKTFGKETLKDISDDPKNLGSYRASKNMKALKL